jgi:hypothetical protein
LFLGLAKAVPVGRGHTNGQPHFRGCQIGFDCRMVVFSRITIQFAGPPFQAGFRHLGVLGFSVP